MPGLPNTSATCPNCGERLREWTLGDVTLDGCDACGGCWFDGGELKSAASLAGEPLEAAEQAFAPGLSTFAGGGPGRCPRCAVKLVERTLAPSMLAVEACPSCGGTWFGEGRLEALAQTLPADRTRRPAEIAAAAVRPLLRPVRCPHCGDPNVADQTTCATCGRSMAEPPEGRAGPLLRRHGFDGATVAAELQYAVWAVIVALILWDSTPNSYGYHHRERIGVTEDLGLLMTLAGAFLFAWYARWLLKTWSIDLSAGGLTVRRITGRRFIPWSAMRRLVALDLPGRVRPSFFAPRDRHYPVNSDFGRAMSHQFDGPPRQARTQTPGPGDRILAEPLRGAVLLFTDHGLVTIGPHLLDSGGLYQTVRDRWDD